VQRALKPEVSRYTLNENIFCIKYYSLLNFHRASSIVGKRINDKESKGARMKSVILKISFYALIVFLTLFLYPVNEAAACDNDCRYERKKFAQEQMIKQKVHRNYVSERSSVLVGVDALFL